MKFQFIYNFRFVITHVFFCSIFLLLFISVNNYLYSQIENHGCDHNNWCPNSTKTTETRIVPVPGYPFCYAKVEFELTRCEQFASVVVLKSVQYLGNCTNLLTQMYPLGLNAPPDEIFLRQMWGQIQVNVLSLAFEEFFNSITDPVIKDTYYCTNPDGTPRNISTYTQQVLINGACLSLCTALLQDINTSEYVVAQRYQDCLENNCCIMYYTYCIDRNTNKAVRTTPVVNTGVWESQCTNTAPPDCPSFVTSNYNVISTFSGTCKFTCQEED